MLPKTWTRAGKTEMPQSLLVKFQIVVQKPNPSKRFVCTSTERPQTNCDSNSNCRFRINPCTCNLQPATCVFCYNINVGFKSNNDLERRTLVTRFIKSINKKLFS